MFRALCSFPYRLHHTKTARIHTPHSRLEGIVWSFQAPSLTATPWGKKEEISESPADNNVDNRELSCSAFAPHRSFASSPFDSPSQLSIDSRHGYRSGPATFSFALLYTIYLQPHHVEYFRLRFCCTDVD